MTAPRILGVDPSLTRTGLGLPDGTCRSLTTDRGDWRFRVANLTSDVMHTVNREHVDLVVIETMMLGKQSGGAEGAWLHGVLRHHLWRASVPYVDVAGASRQKWACGHQKDRTKDAVYGGAIRAGAPCANNDEADAWWLADIGRAAYGPTDAPHPLYRLEVLARYPWPTVRNVTPAWATPPKAKKPRKAAA